MLPLRMVLLIVLLLRELTKVIGPVPLMVPERTAVRPLPSMVLVAEPVGVANTKLVLYAPGSLIKIVPPEIVVAVGDVMSVDWPAGTLAATQRFKAVAP